MRIHRLLPVASFSFAVSLLLSPVYVAHAQDDDWQVDEPSSQPQVQPEEPAVRTQEPVSAQPRARKRRAEPVLPRNDEGGVTDAPQSGEGKKKKSKTQDDVAEFVMKRFSISGNPLNLAINSFSLNGEYVFAKHHGLIVTPSFVVSQKDALLDPLLEARGDVGIEAGYRFYSGNRGPNGFFVGPSLIYMYMYRRAIRDKDDKYLGRESYSVYGFAVDLGGAHVARNGFFIGAGAGMMFLKSTQLRDSVPKEKNGKALRVSWPRVLFFVGQAF